MTNPASFDPDIARSAMTLCSISSRSNSSALQPRRNALACSLASCSASRVPAGSTGNVESPKNQPSHAKVRSKGEVIAAAEYPPPADAHPLHSDKAVAPATSNRESLPPAAPPKRYREHAHTPAAA